MSLRKRDNESSCLRLRHSRPVCRRSSTGYIQGSPPEESKHIISNFYFSQQHHIIQTLYRARTFQRLNTSSNTTLHKQLYHSCTWPANDIYHLPPSTIPGSTQQSMSDSLSCPICLDETTNPESTICGHVFCSVCLARVLESSDEPRCPLCRQDLHAEDQQNNDQDTVYDSDEGYFSGDEDSEPQQQTLSERCLQARADVWPLLGRAQWDLDVILNGGRYMAFTKVLAQNLHDSIANCIFDEIVSDLYDQSELDTMKEEILWAADKIALMKVDPRYRWH